MRAEQRIFHQNAFGHAWQCHCADAVHIQFGNVAILPSHSQLQDFTMYISETIAQESCAEDTGSRDIYIPARDLAMMFTMTCTELQMLDEILNQTLLAIEINNILYN